VKFSTTLGKLSTTLKELSTTGDTEDTEVESLRKGLFLRVPSVLCGE